jgi:hypothetical protein
VIAADGSVLLNVAHLETSQDPKVLLDRAMAEGGELFIGVRLVPREAREALRLLDDRAAEAAGVIGGRRHRRRRAKDRKSKRIGS